MMATSDDNNSDGTFDERDERAGSPSSGAPLLDLLSLMRREKFQSTIPDAVTEKLLQASGCASSDPKMTKLVSLAAQTFMSVVARDALQHYKVRGAPHSGRVKGKDGRDEPRNVLLMEDLTACMAERGVVVRKPTYFV